MLKIFFILFIYLSKNLNSIKVKQNTLDLKFELKSVAIIIYFSSSFCAPSILNKFMMRFLQRNNLDFFLSIYIFIYNCSWARKKTNGPFMLLYLVLSLLFFDSKIFLLREGSMITVVPNLESFQFFWLLLHFVLILFFAFNDAYSKQNN